MIKRTLKRIWCGLVVGHTNKWTCVEYYSDGKGWQLMSVGTCMTCGHNTEMKKVVGK